MIFFFFGCVSFLNKLELFSVVKISLKSGKKALWLETHTVGGTDHAGMGFFWLVFVVC